MDAPRPPKNCDLLVVGGGIVGLAVARELQRYGPGRLDLRAGARAEPRHPPDRALQRRRPRRDLLQARVAEGAAVRRGARATSTPTATSAGSAHERSGKLIVATEPKRAPAARRARAPRGRERGARTAAGRRRTRSAEIEPHAAGIDALHSPATGVVDFGEIARFLCGGCCREPGRRLLRAAGSRPSARAPGESRRGTRWEQRRPASRSFAPARGRTGWRWPPERPTSRGSSRSGAATCGCGPSAARCFARASTRSRTRTCRSSELTSPGPSMATSCSGRRR